MAAKRVNIVHPDGREYSIAPGDFTKKSVSPERKSYAEQGFRIVDHVDGTPYDGPKTLREIERAAEARQVARATVPAADRSRGKGEG